ncbi:MAG: NDP-sugar synthase [Pseudomonadota bacterium]|nr:NDP-sugar synthase [Pseudomonadota bacterium]
MSDWTAMVLAAGYGTRLRPLTEEMPKPLIPVVNQPLLSMVLRHLFRWQPRRVVVNGHHLSQQVHDFLLSSPRAESISFIHEKNILGTGGGIRNAAAKLGGEFFVTINGDVLTDLPLDLVMDFHRQQDVLATMVFHDYPRFNSVQVAGQRIVSFNQKYTSTDKTQLLAYTGIQICSPRLLSIFSGSGFISIIDVYEQLLREEREQIAAYIMPAGQYYWRDLGTVGDYLNIHRDLRENPALAHSLLGHKVDFPLVAPGAKVSGAELSGVTVIAPRCELGLGSRVEDSILWPGVSIGRECRLQRSIVGQNVKIPAGSILMDQVLVNEKREVIN